MDSRMYLTTQNSKRKKHLTKGTKDKALTEGTKDKAETKWNSVLDAKTEEVERVNLAEPVDGNRNIASSEKKTQGSLRMNIDTRQYNRQHRAETEDDKHGDTEHQAKA